MQCVFLEGKTFFLSRGQLKCFFTQYYMFIVSSHLTDMEFGHSLNDTLMRFFDHCAKFVHGVDNNASAVVEVDEFKQGPEMRRVQENIARRLGVPHSLITYGDTYGGKKSFAHVFSKAN